MKIAKIREMSGDELKDRRDQLAEEIFRARIQKETGQMDQAGKARSLRRDLARIKTVLRELEKSAG